MGSLNINAIIVAVFLIIICVTLIICCVAFCCLLYKKFRKRHDQKHIVNTPQPPTSPSEYQPSYAGYHSVPGHEGPSVPTAPPSYLESTSPGHLPVSFTQGLPMYTLHPPSEPYAQPSVSDELVNPPYNPSYVPDL